MKSCPIHPTNVGTNNLSSSSNITIDKDTLCDIIIDAHLYVNNNSNKSKMFLTYWKVFFCKHCEMVAVAQWMIFYIELQKFQNDDFAVWHPDRPGTHPVHKITDTFQSFETSCKENLPERQMN